MKKFITFGAGQGERFRNNIIRICNEAKDFEYFDEICGFTEHDLINDTEFWNNNGNFIINNHRGFGYWIWKSHIINKELEKLSDGDILVYTDAGCVINKHGKQRFLEYIDLLNKDENNYGLLSFRLPFKEYQYTKKLVFDYFNADDQLKNSWQYVGGIQIIKKTPHSSFIIKQWSEITKNHMLINDVISIDEDSRFIENRHDQSIYSLLVNKYGSIKIDDETYNWDDPSDWSKVDHGPILAKRL
jgi:hypothetical protein